MKVEILKKNVPKTEQKMTVNVNGMLNPVKVHVNLSNLFLHLNMFVYPFVIEENGCLMENL